MQMGAGCCETIRKICGVGWGGREANAGLIKSSHGLPGREVREVSRVLCGVQGQAALVLRVPWGNEWNVACRCIPQSLMAQPWLPRPVVVPARPPALGAPAPA